MAFTYKWNLSDLKKVKKNGLKVFSCFACGGGSTMGYKMSGFEVIGCNEIDPEMIEMYRKNHQPSLSFLESIQTFRKRDDLPSELFELDILDGSPPCSSFSMSGSREGAWGKNKKFREGQAEQVLDNLFFDFIELARKLKPKVVVAENVKGMLAGNARGYVKEVIRQFDRAGYDVQLFLLNGASMGLPQARERVFFICKRRDLKLGKIKLEFSEEPIPYSAIENKTTKFGVKECSPDQLLWWKRTIPGKPFSSVHPKGSWFNSFKVSPDQTLNTIAASFRSSASGLYHYSEPRHLHIEDYILAGSYPQDYKFKHPKIAPYMIGMSVPPIMMHKISEQIYKQWFKKNKK